MSSSSILLPVESALLTLTTPPSTSSDLVTAATTCDARAALTSPFARSLLVARRSSSTASSSTPTTFEAGVRFPQPGSYAEEDLLAVAVAALHAYAQQNWTGPSLEVKAVECFTFEGSEGSEGQEGQQEKDDAALNEYAIDQLALAGEPVYHLSKGTAFLLIALQILGLVSSPFSPPTSSSDTSPSTALLHTATAPFPAAAAAFPTLRSLPLWRLRAGIMWLKILDEPVPLPSYIASSAASLRSSLPPSSPERASATLSLSLLASLLSRASPHSSAQKEATVLAQAAAEESRLEWELTGRMGKRTKWQIDEKTQLVVLARDGSEQKVKEEKEGEEKKQEGEDLQGDEEEGRSL